MLKTWLGIAHINFFSYLCTMNKKKTYYLICLKKDGIESVLHSDRNFYLGYFSMRGCYYIIYKRRKNAEKKLNEIKGLITSGQLYIKEVN